MICFECKGQGFTSVMSKDGKRYMLYPHPVSRGRIEHRRCERKCHLCAGTGKIEWCAIGEPER